MPILFNALLEAEGLNPADVRLLRHQDQRALPAPDKFEAYQALQDFGNRSRFADARYWASFVVTPMGETLFSGLFQASYIGVLDHSLPRPTSDEVDEPGSCDEYKLDRLNLIQEYEGRLVIDWGSGTRSWIQRADNQNKPVLELRKDIVDPAFPGYAAIQLSLSDLYGLPATWKTALSNAKGIYLLTCTATGKQYVGMATGEGGFFQRWLDYAADGHGGNAALRDRTASDYCVSILETVGSMASDAENASLESQWKQKLMTRKFGLNLN